MAVAWSSADSRRPSADGAPDTTPSRERRSAAPTKPKPSPSATRTKRPAVGESPAQSIPSSGPGTFTVAPGTGERTGAGAGRVLRYKVEVEDGLSLPLEATAREVERVLGDPRGWTADGKSGFQRVADGPTDFAVRIATAATVDSICGQYGLDTGGELNCSVDRNVMVNLKRWIRATPVYAKDVTAYRALIINHEVGHFLGHGHVTCPGEGEPAPAMMQQIKGMRGCVPNVWPYDEDGRLITGPAVP